MEKDKAAESGVKLVRGDSLHMVGGELVACTADGVVTVAEKRPILHVKMGAAELVPRSEVERQAAIKVAGRRARTWNEANRESYEARNQERMAKRRAKT
jgi:hypothetical protein